jgi:selenocysteine-specific translation elongation factor
VPAAIAGDRCAPSLAGNLQKDDTRRGDWRVASETRRPTAS